MACCIVGCVTALMACTTLMAPLRSLPADVGHASSAQTQVDPGRRPTISARTTFASHETLDFRLPHKASWSERPDLRVQNARVVYSRAF